MSNIPSKTKLDAYVDMGLLISKRHDELPLTIYNYSQLTVMDQLWNSVTRICRGLVVDDKGRCVVRCIPKFFNAYEPHAHFFKNEAGSETITILNSEGEEEEVVKRENSDELYYTDKMDGCFPYNATVDLWGGGRIKIGELVNKKIEAVVVGWDENGIPVPSKVTNWHRNGVKHNWLGIKVDTPVNFYGRSGNKDNIIRCTANHKVFSRGEYVVADQLRVGDRLQTYYIDIEDNDIILGGLLGDGSICKGGINYNYQECHGEKQRGYTEYLRSHFDPELLVNANDTVGGYADTAKVWLQTKTCANLTKLRKEWYPKFGVKVVPEDLSFMNDAVVAKWYMDDGSLSHSEFQNDRACLSTNGFCKEDVDRLAQKLEEMYGVDTTVFDNKGWSIRINYSKATINSFWEAVAKYVPDSMLYKIPDNFKERELIGFDKINCLQIPTESKIIEIDTNPTFTSQRNDGGAIGFDISTETVNYTVQGIHVHNSLIQMVNDEEYGFIVTSKGSFNSDQSKWAKEIYLKHFDPEHLDTGRSYICELIHPENRIVLNYGDTEELRLIAVIETETGQENVDIHSRTWSSFIEPVARVVNLEAHMDSLNEGVVAVYPGAHRVKHKTDEYVRLHRIVTDFTPKRVWEALKEGDNLEFHNMPEEFDKWLEETKAEFTNKYNGLWEAAHIDFVGTQEWSDKELGLCKVIDPKIKGLVFMIRNNKPIHDKIWNMIKP